MPHSAERAALPWSNTYAVGHGELDRQHRALVDSINEIDHTIRARNGVRLARHMKALRLAADEHFRDENAILWQFLTGTRKSSRSMAVPKRSGLITTTAFEKHVAVHDALLAGLDNIVLEPLAAVMDRLKFWFVDHVVRHDSHIRAVFGSLSR